MNLCESEEEKKTTNYCCKLISIDCENDGTATAKRHMNIEVQNKNNDKKNEKS